MGKKKDYIEEVTNLEKTPEKEEKKFNICPYCGDEMELRFDNNTNGYFRMSSRAYNPPIDGVKHHISYMCLSCGCSSPHIIPDVTLFDESKVIDAIEKRIVFVKDERERYEKELDAVEEAYDDE